MELKMEIICKNFEQRKISDNGKIYRVEKSEEYYVIPLNKSYDMEYDDEVFKLTFKNQELWLKYSNRFKQLLLKTNHYTEFVLIKSEDILDIYVNIMTDNYFKKTMKTLSPYICNEYFNKYILALPIINTMIDIEKAHGKTSEFNIKMITNEALLKKLEYKHFTVTNNFLLNRDALFIVVDDSDANKFYEL